MSQHTLGLITGAPKLINSDLFLEKRATVPFYRYCSTFFQKPRFSSGFSVSGKTTFFQKQITINTLIQYLFIGTVARFSKTNHYYYRIHISCPGVFLQNFLTCSIHTEKLNTCNTFKTSAVKLHQIGSKPSLGICTNGTL